MFVLLLLHCSLLEIRATLPGKSTAAPRAALPISVSVCCSLVCPGDGIAASILDFERATDVDAYSCTQLVRTA